MSSPRSGCPNMSARPASLSTLRRWRRCWRPVVGCSTTPSHPSGGSKIGRRTFMGRYIFPDGELLDVGDTVHAMQDAGFEVRDVESLREHYALTLRRVGRQPRRTLGRSRRPRRTRASPGVAAVHGGVRSRLRGRRHRDPSGARRHRQPGRCQRDAPHAQRVGDGRISAELIDHECRDGRPDHRRRRCAPCAWQ